MKSNIRKMKPRTPRSRALYVPSFGSQQCSSQAEAPESQPDLLTSAERVHSLIQNHAERRGKRRTDGKTRSVFKVKFPKLQIRSLRRKTGKDHEPTAGSLKEHRTVSHGAEEQGGATAAELKKCVPAGESVFLLSDRPLLKSTVGIEKAKLMVLRTISRMLEENRLIRQRLLAQTQAN